MFDKVKKILITASVRHLKKNLLDMKDREAVVISCRGKLYSILGYKTTIDLGTKERRFVIIAGKSFKDFLEQFDEVPGPLYYDLESDIT